MLGKEMHENNVEHLALLFDAKHCGCIAHRSVYHYLHTFTSSNWFVSKFRTMPKKSCAALLNIISCCVDTAACVCFDDVCSTAVGPHPLKRRNILFCQVLSSQSIASCIHHYSLILYQLHVCSFKHMLSA